VSLRFGDDVHRALRASIFSGREVDRNGEKSLADLDSGAQIT
jgi:hypothetical protein